MRALTFLASRWLLVLVFLLGGLANTGRAEERSRLVPQSPELVARGERVGVWLWSERNREAAWTYVICHGMGGTLPSDRFHELAGAIHAEHPECDVILLDWSAAAKLIWPWKVARQIDPVAVEAKLLLQEIGLGPQRTTLIGESFGNYVNARLAQELGGVQHVLAFNPASELGGYQVPDLRKVAHLTWSFHTYSLYDTRCELAHNDLFLETPTDASPTAQHTFGIVWLTQRMNGGDSSWLRLEKQLPERAADAFSAKATLAGEVDDVRISRLPKPPVSDRTTLIAAEE